jgi:hypothetical protein
MDKPLEFTSLHELVKNFDEAYKECGHRLIKVKYASSSEWYSWIVMIDFEVIHYQN